MSVSQFCSFCGAYLGAIASMQVLRREGAGRVGAASTLMVLMTFKEQEGADNFFRDFNATPFSTLEPEILCR
jgi:BRCA1-associated protein